MGPEDGVSSCDRSIAKKELHLPIAGFHRTMLEYTTATARRERTPRVTTIMHGRRQSAEDGIVVAGDEHPRRERSHPCRCVLGRSERVGIGMLCLVARRTASWSNSGTRRLRTVLSFELITNRAAVSRLPRLSTRFVRRFAVRKRALRSNLRQLRASVAAPHRERRSSIPSPRPSR